jgi:hypothetical protein
MARPVTLFMIMPPVDLNDQMVEQAIYLETQLATEFPGYEFRVVNLDAFKSIDGSRRVQFGTGDEFAVIPMMGSVGDGDTPGYLCAEPDRSLIEEITKMCQSFDVEKMQRAAA